jgi:hypothetical protein
VKVSAGATGRTSSGDIRERLRLVSRHEPMGARQDGITRHHKIALHGVPPDVIGQKSA